MSALHLLRRLAVREVRFLHELERGFPYAVVAVDRITVGRHHWSILHVQRDDSFMKVVLENNIFSEAEELLISVGVTECVLVYNGLNVDSRATYRILCFDTLAGQLIEK